MNGLLAVFLAGLAGGASEPVDLGLANFPEDERPAATRYQWESWPLLPRTYLAGFGLAPRIGRYVEDDHRAFGKKLQLERVGRDRIRFLASPGCMRHMGCVYEELAGRSAEIVAPLARLFLERAKAAKLDSSELAGLIISFVQSLRYDVPADEPFGILPPPLVAYEAWGDCDSKALLALLLLRECGIEAVLLSSPRYAHAAIGVALPGAGMSIEQNGSRFLYTEVTSPGWPIGKAPPQYGNPDLWEVAWPQ